jgi:hypothetical protein
MNNVEINLTDPRKAIHELEDKILERIGLDYRLKEIKKPFAVLKLDRSDVLLGSTKEIVGKVDYNYSFKNALQEVVGSLIGNTYVKVEVKVAEAEFQALKKRLDGKIAKQKKEAEILAGIDAQRKEGKCNLIPFPLKENKVRSELTIERHAIFAANTFKGDFRTYERRIKNPVSGEEFILRVEIGDNTGCVRAGVLMQKHQEAFYKLSQIWSEQRYQIIENEKRILFGSIELSIYDLVQRLRGDDGGQKYKKVLQLLKEMAAIRVNIKTINIKEGTYDVQDFSLLSYEWQAKNFNEKILRPTSDGESRVYIRFSDFVTDNFLRKNVKSLMLNPYFSLKDKGRKGVAQLLYTMLDYELASKDKFHISLLKLGERLGLSHYRFKSKRKEKINGSISMVNGSPILDGNYKINAYIVDAEDKKDWILVARKVDNP